MRQIDEISSINSAPLEVFCSSQDLNRLCVCVNIDKQNGIAFFYDSTDGGNGCCEAIFDNFLSIAAKAHELAARCDCSWGYPRCLFRHGCSHNNEFLNKELGLFILESCVLIERRTGILQ